MSVKETRFGWRFYFLLFFAGLLISISTAILETAPGYMDADYYFAGAKRISTGQGASEPYLWNYLNDPAALPAPSFAYWMPLVSLVSSAGLGLFPALDFWGARIPLILLASVIPALTAMLSLRLSARPAAARLAGILALFPGFYLAYLTSTDVFALEMVLGAQFFLLVSGRNNKPSRLAETAKYIGLGLIAGLLHLARADGILWLGAALAAVIPSSRQVKRAQVSHLLVFMAAVLSGYLIVMAPWLARNLGEWGSFFPPGGSRAMWVSEYEQTMIYPASMVNPASWLAAGWASHIHARLNAFGVVLQTSVAVQGVVLLFPFILAGLWCRRLELPVQLGAGMWVLMALVMLVVFPFAASNGSYFHSVAALQPLLWAVAPIGLETLMSKYSRWRKISREQDMAHFMAVVVVVTVALLSGVTYYQRVVGNQPGTVNWNVSDIHYRDVETELVRLGALPGEAVLVNNPPGYWLASRRPALVIPYGDTNMLLAVARRYGAGYLILEQNNPWQLADLYHARIELPELAYLGSVKTTRLYRITFEE